MRFIINFGHKPIQPDADTEGGKSAWSYQYLTYTRATDMQKTNLDTFVH